MINGSRLAPGRGADQWLRLLWAGLILAILLLATALRFQRLGEQSLWYDEGVAYAHSLRTLPELIEILPRNVHVPAYFTLLGWWQDVTGSSEFALRALSALCSILSVAWTYALGRRLYHPLAGLAAAALLTLNSFNIYYAQEARMYAMLTAVAGASMWLFVGWLRNQATRGKRRAPVKRMVALGLVNALGIYTHYAYALIVLTQVALAAFWLCFTYFSQRPAERLSPPIWQRLLRLLMPYLLTMVLFLPWLPIALSQLGHKLSFTELQPASQVQYQTLGYIAIGSAIEANVGLVTVAVGLFLLFGLKPSTSRQRDWWSDYLPAAWALLSLAGYLVVGLADSFLRFLLPTQLAFALWAGRGVWLLWTARIGRGLWLLRQIPRAAAAMALTVCFIALLRGLEDLSHHPDFRRDDMRGLARRMESDLQPGDAVIVSALGLKELLGYYYQAGAPVFGLPTVADDDITKAQVLEIIAAHNRLHVIFYGADQQDPNLVIETTLNNHAFEISDRWVDDLRYARYETMSTLGELMAAGQALGDSIVLQAYALGADVVSAGDALTVQLVWSTRAALSQRYKVFLQLLDAQGRLAAQRDSEPAGGSAMTNTWPVAEAIVDNHALQIPSDLPAGDYSLIAGLYDIKDPMARLPVAGGAYINLATVTVQ